MQSRRKLWTILLVAVIGLMFAGAGFLLVKGFMAFAQAEKQLGAKKGELEFLFGRDPFPSEANLKVERANLSLLNDQLADLLGEMARGQVQSEEQSPNKFGAQFWDVRKELFARARDRGVKIDGSFDFGFAKHMSGVPPAPQDVARLTQQLRIVQRLCLLMFDSGITGMEGLGREEFEVDAKTSGQSEPQVRRARRGAAEAVVLNTYNANAGVIPESDLFGRWRFVLHFTAKEDVLLSVLNRLARDPLFVSVADLVIEGDAGIKQWNTEAASAKTEAGEAVKEGEAASAAAVPRDLRIVCGRDVPLKTKMTLDVYQFRVMRPSPAAKPGEGAK